MAEKSRLRRTISNWANASDMHARELRRDTRKSGVARIGEAIALKPPHALENPTA